MKAVSVMKTLAIAVVAAVGMNQVAQAQILYSQNFEPPVPLSSQSAAFGGFGQINNISGTGWQVQGGGGGGGISVTTGVDTNGVGGSQALFVNPDHSAATGFTFNQYTVYGAVGAANVPASQVKVDLDLFMSGSESSNTPIDVLIQNNNVDMAFTPTLTNGQYTHVSYFLSSATNVGSFVQTMSSNLRLQHGAGGFGFDANNIVRVDNIVVKAVPEPSTLALCGLGLLGLIRWCRRRA